MAITGDHMGYERPWKTAERLAGPRTFFGVAIGGGLLLLALGAGMTFFSDEWAFIESRSLGDPVDWFRPHNEHWSTLPIVLYRLMVETIGIGSYVPYLAVVIALHVAVALLVYRLVERRSGRVPAFLGGTLVLLFGAGFENLFWAFQTGFVGSVLFGLAALDLTDRGPSRGRAAAVALLLLLSLMASGTGVVMSIVVGLEWLADDRWRSRIPWLALPAGAFFAWYVAFGRGGVATMRNPFSLEAAGDVPRFVIGGLGDAAGALTGVGPFAGIAVAAVIVGWAVFRAARGTLPPRAFALLVAIAMHYALIGLVRGGLFDGQVHYTRYAYVAGILVILAVSTLAGQPSVRLASRARPFVVAGAVSVVGLAFAYNGALLLGGRDLFLDRADMTRALVEAGLHRPLPASTSPTRSLVLVPSPVALERITAAYGDPRSDALVPWAVRAAPPALRAEAERRVRDGAPIPVAGDQALGPGRGPGQGEGAVAPPGG